jgi:hypothetical protein
VGHPRIGAFERTANGQHPAGAHDPGREQQRPTARCTRIAYDEIHDEIRRAVEGGAGDHDVPRGAANGDEAPIRIIQGPKTGLRQFDKDRESIRFNNEVMAVFGNSVVIFNRHGQRDVAPKRVLQPARQQGEPRARGTRSTTSSSWRAATASGCSTGSRREETLKPIGHYWRRTEDAASASGTACAIYPPTARSSSMFRV